MDMDTTTVIVSFSITENSNGKITYLCANQKVNFLPTDSMLAFQVIHSSIMVVTE